MASCFVVHLLRLPTIGFFVGFHAGVDLLRSLMVGFFVGFHVGNSDGNVRSNKVIILNHVRQDRYFFFLLTWMLHHPLKFFVLLILNQ